VRRTALTHLETYLQTARVLHASTFPTEEGHAHPSYLVVLEGGVGVLAKPEDEIGDGQVLVRREVGAWIVAREMGWLDLVSTTVLRPMKSPKHGAMVDASFQIVWPNPLPNAPLETFDDEDVWRAAVFDFLVHQTDRGGHNWLAVPGPGEGHFPQLKLTDHGYAFDESRGNAQSTFLDAKRGEEVPFDALEAVRRLRARLPSSEVSDHMTMEVIDQVTGRADSLLASGRF